jgi:hypothetical protein
MAIGLAETQVQLARQRYRFEYLAAQPALTGLEGKYAQVLYVGARAVNRGAQPALESMTVLVNARLTDRRSIQARVQVRLEGIGSGQKGIVFFPVPLPEEFDPRRLPEIDRVSIQVEANPAPRARSEEFVEFGAPASAGLRLAVVDMDAPDSPIVYLDGREVLAGRHKGRLIRPKIPFWTGPGTAAAAVEGNGTHGQPVRQIESQNEWEKIRTFPGKTAWVPGMLLSESAPPSEAPATTKVRNYGSFRFVDYSVFPGRTGGTVVEGRMLNDTGSFYDLASFEVLLEDRAGRLLVTGQTSIREFQRKDVAPFMAVFEDVPSYQVARARFRLLDTEKKTEVILIEGTAP